MRLATSCTFAVLLTTLGLFGCDSGTAGFSGIGGTYVGGYEYDERPGSVFKSDYTFEIPSTSNGSTFRFDVEYTCVSGACQVYEDYTVSGTGSYNHPIIQSSNHPIMSMNVDEPNDVSGSHASSYEGVVSPDFQTLTIEYFEEFNADIVVTRQ